MCILACLYLSFSFGVVISQDIHPLYYASIIISNNVPYQLVYVSGYARYNARITAPILRTLL